MKRKLVAALLSVAMVASVTPVSALSPVAVVEAAESPALTSFKTAMNELQMIQDQGVITPDSVGRAHRAYSAAVTACNDMKGWTEEEKADPANQALIDKLAEAKKTIIAAYEKKADNLIVATAKPESVDENTDSVVTEINSILNILKGLGVETETELRNGIPNYAKIKQITDAILVDVAVKKVLGEKPTDENFVTRIDNYVKAEGISSEACKLAVGYKDYLEAKARVDQNDSADAIVGDAITRLTERKGLLNTERTAARVEQAEVEITKSDAAVDAVRDKATANKVAEYDNLVEDLKELIDTVKGELKDKSEASEFAKKVEDLLAKGITAEDIAEIDAIADKANQKYVSLDTKAQIDNILGQFKRLVENTKNKDAAFTAAVIKAYAVPEVADVKHTQANKDAIDAAYNFFMGNKVIADNIDVSSKLDVTSVAYIDAQAKASAAKSRWDALDQEAVNGPEAAFRYAMSILEAHLMNDNDAYKAHLGTTAGYLESAQKAYDSLDDYSKSKDMPKDNQAGIKTLYSKLEEYIKTYNKHVAEEFEEEIIKTLTTGTLSIKDRVENDKLTIADKDFVYNLRDSYALLSDAKKADFKNTHKGEYKILTDAIKAIDNLFVVDLEKQIDALVKVKKDATLAEIKAAKAANKAARDAYNALTDTQQGAVNNFNLIGEAEQAVKEAEVEYVKAQIGEIVKIDLSKLTIDQAKNIIEVQSIISGMDAKQKGQIKALEDGSVGNADYKKALAAASELVAKAASLENATITAIDDQTYTGEDIQPAVEVKDMSGAVVDASEYKVAYKNNVDAGTATVVVSALDGGKYTGTKEINFTIKAADISEAAVSGATKTYTGKAVTTTVKAVVGEKTLTAGTDYEVTSYENNTNVGTATITITGKGNYTGTATGSFVVKPGKVNLTKVTAGTKKATAKYTGKPGASYKVIYAVKGTTKYKAVYSKSLSKAITGLKSGTTYKVKVLAYYKDANGKAYYTGYSNMRTVKVK